MSEIKNTIDFIEAGLRAEALKQKAIANNIANLETPGYRSLDVKFEDILSDAMNSSVKVDSADLEPKLYRPYSTPVQPNGNDVSLEAEVGKMVKNNLKHTTYIRLLNKKFRQISIAIDVD